MQKTLAKDYIKIPREEYRGLKTLQKHFGAFWHYFEHLRIIHDAREDIKEKRTVSQENLFKELDL